MASTELVWLDLPTDGPRGNTARDRHVETTVELAAPLAAGLRAAARQAGVPLFELLLAGFVGVMHRYTGKAEIVVASGAVVLRCDLHGDPSLRILLERIARARRAAVERRDGGEHGRVAVAIHEDDEAPAGVGPSRSELDISLTVRGAGSVASASVAIDIAYDAALFRDSTIRRLCGHVEVLLADAVARSNEPLSVLALIGPDERELLLRAGSGERRPIAGESLIELFERQAALTPDAPAFIHGGVELTYGELRARAEALARRLVSSSVRRGQLVGVYVQRTFDYPVAMLAVLRAGAACLPLEPSYPPEPLRHLVSDAKPALVITDESAGSAGDAFDATGTALLNILDGTPAEAGPLPAWHADPDDLMYVIYTSGSTGTPKGVEVPHRVALNRLAWMWREYPFAAGEVCCQRTPSNFVDSFWELFGPLLQGVPTVLVPTSLLRDGTGFVELMSTYGVTRLWIVPTFLREMLDAADDLAARLPLLTFWVSIGEALPAGLLARFEGAMAHATLFNVYGTSEVWDATWWDPREHADDLWRVPIGRPIDNVEVCVVDAGLRPLPTGVPGELLVGGAGLGRGYLGDPELTARQFVGDPRRPDGGGRMYRTGDLVRVLDGGEIEFIGRIDDQLAVRGYRIEPGEVEALLARHPDVAAAVAVREEDGATSLLAAFIVAAQGRVPRAAELHAHMLRVAPWFLVPAAFGELAQVPITYNGKIDRRALGSVRSAPLAP